MSVMTNRLPWPRPISAYDTAGPRDGGTVKFSVAGCDFRVSETDVIAPTTLRTRFKTECLACALVLHRATTGPGSYIEDHLRDVHGFEGKLGYSDDADAASAPAPEMKP